MDGISILLMLVVLIVLIGVLVYVIRDYYLHKDENAADFEATKRDLTTEKTDRLGNVRYIVDRVNTINEDIYNTFTKTAETTTSNIDALSAAQNKTLLGLDAFVRFTSNEPVLAAASTTATAPSPALNILNLPGAPTANAELIRHTSFLGGMTARDLKPEGGVAARFCAPPATAGAAPKCVEFPSADGNTYLTPLVDGKAIQLDGPTAVSGALSFHTSFADTAAAATAPSLSALPDKMLSVQASRTAFGGENYAPGATVEIRAGPAGAVPVPAFRISTANNASEALLVDANGDITVSKLVVKRPGTAAGVALSISPDSDQKLVVAGDLHVTGNLHYTAPAPPSAPAPAPSPVPAPAPAPAPAPEVTVSA